MIASWQSMLLLAVGCEAAVLLSKTHASLLAPLLGVSGPAAQLRLAPRCRATEAGGGAKAEAHTLYPLLSLPACLCNPSVGVW